ncbi:MAG: lipocalin family protein [Bacteroidales bacterium]|nr:lipocalin family protein [Bacteroidales bacterium]
MKKYLLMAACALALVACKKDGGEEPVPPVPTQGIVGTWELVSVATKATVGDIQVSVYVDFNSSGNFTLYQKIGMGRYTKFEGTYTLTSDNKLAGSYGDNSSWGPYDAVVSGETLTLTTAGGKEVDTYKRISLFPEDVLRNTY